MDYGDRKETFSFLLQVTSITTGSVCFLRSNGELGKYSRKKSLIKENYTRNQRGSFPIGPDAYSQRIRLCYKNTIPLPASILPACQSPRRLVAAMAEWLRRLTRNQMESSSVGSNPARSVKF